MADASTMHHSTHMYRPAVRGFLDAIHHRIDESSRYRKSKTVALFSYIYFNVTKSNIAFKYNTPRRRLQGLGRLASQY